jgi:hypothetical protein
MQSKNSKNKATNGIKKVIQSFLKSNSESDKVGCYVIQGDSLVYRTPITEEISITSNKLDDFIDDVNQGRVVLVSPTLAGLKDAQKHKANVYVKIRYLAENQIAKRISQNGCTLYVGNNDVLELIGRKTSFGRASDNRKKTEIQERLEKLIPMLSFNRFFGNDGASDLRYQCAGWKHINEQRVGVLEIEKSDAA